MEKDLNENDIKGTAGTASERAPSGDSDGSGEEAAERTVKSANASTEETAGDGSGVSEKGGKASEDGGASGNGKEPAGNVGDTAGDPEKTSADRGGDSGNSENGDGESGDGSEASGDGEEPKKKGGFFKKKEKKKDPKDEKIEELNDRLMRNLAEFDNFRKRTEKEKSQMFAAGASSVIERILPVIDDFERGLAALGTEEKGTSFAQGVEMIYKKLMSTLTDLGLQPIEALGKDFDPTYHNAVMQSPSEEYESGVVMQELQKGYMFKDKIVRHSMVVVAE